MDTGNMAAEAAFVPCLPYQFLNDEVSIAFAHGDRGYPAYLHQLECANVAMQKSLVAFTSHLQRLPE